MRAAPAGRPALPADRQRVGRPVPSVSFCERSAPIIFRLYEFWVCAQPDQLPTRTGSSSIAGLIRTPAVLKVAKRMGSLGIPLGIAASAFLLAGCGELPQTIMDPAGSNARQTLDLFIIVLIGAAIILVGVEGWIIYAMVAYRRRKGNDAIPRQVHGNKTLEVIWTAIPAAIVIALAVLTIRTISIQAAEPAPDALRVSVYGNQWWWEFEYPEQGITTANEIYLVVDREVALTLHSNDVIHGFWIPKLSGKMDVVPGRVNGFKFTPEIEGVYEGQCTEFCGWAHTDMRVKTHVVSQAEFDEWTAIQRTEPSAEAQESEGARLMVSKTCNACHAVRGTILQGQVGPELTAFGVRTVIGSNLIENTPQNLRAWIKDPAQIKPGVLMPTLGLTDAETDAIATFLEGLR